MILWVRERFKWMGTHSGYDEIFAAISTVQPGDYASVWREPDKPKSKLQRRFLNRISQGAQVGPFYNYDSAAAELSALWECFRSKHALVHIAYVENNLGILPRFKHTQGFKVLGTAHQPASFWRLLHSHPKSLCALDGLIVLSQSEVSYFEQFLPDRVYCIPHGVDTEFFRPGTKNGQISERPRCVFSGSWLRDLESLACVIDQVLARDPSIQFDMIVPQSNRNQTAFHQIARHEQVFWHAGVSDEQLRNIYQRANCILLPFLNSTANNALLEAIACGLPVVSNRVGGTTDYTRPSFSHLHPVGDVDNMVESVLQLMDDQEQRQRMGVQARLFAEQNFSWSHIARQTSAVYDQLLIDTKS